MTPKFCPGVGGDSTIRDQYVDFLDAADDGSASHTDLARVGDDNHLSGVANHHPGDGCFFDLDHGCTVLHVDARYAQDDAIQNESFNCFVRGRACERERARPYHAPSRERCVRTFGRAEFETDVHRVGEYPQAFATTQGARHLRGRGASCQTDGLAVLDQGCCPQGDPLFLTLEALLAFGEGSVETEGLVGLAGEHGATVGAMHKALLLQSGKVAANTGRGSLEMFSELFNGGFALVKKEVQDLLGALLGLLSHGVILRTLA